MEVKKSYKKTEVGLIPEDWNIYDLRHVLNGIADVDHYMPKTQKYGVPYVMTGDLKEQVSDIDFDKCKKISVTDYKKLSKKVKNVKGDIILARYATVGTVSLVNIDIDFIVSYSCVTIKPDTYKLFGSFLYYYFKSSIFKLEVKNKVNANIQDNVGIGDLLTLKIPLPPTLKEQTAIATVLSDTDAWINSLEQLLTKKRQIKQGAMQELLKPKEGWEVKKLGEICHIIKGKQYNSSLLKDTGLYPCYSGGINPSGYSDDYNEEGDLIIISEGGNSCGYVNFIKTKFWLGGHCYKLNFTSNNFNQMFFYHFFKNYQNKICISAFNHTPVILAITSLSKILSPK
uniref:restriction endonuclease subunit S n=1 Tax=Flavobacterium sp. TaxID=239 RepID=UPI00404905D4